MAVWVLRAVLLVEKALGSLQEVITNGLPGELDHSALSVPPITRVDEAEEDGLVVLTKEAVAQVSLYEAAFLLDGVWLP